jgi:hypothetical protein
LLAHGIELEKASGWIDESLEHERNWMNVWTRAELFAKAGDVENALKAGAEALAICKRDEKYCPYVKTYGARLEKWSRSRDAD